MSEKKRKSLPLDETKQKKKKRRHTIGNSLHLSRDKSSTGPSDHSSEQAEDVFGLNSERISSDSEEDVNAIKSYSLRYRCPEEFERVNFSEITKSLRADDLKEKNTELFFVQIPFDCDVEGFRNQEICLHGDSVIETSTEEKSASWQVHTQYDKSLQESNLQLLLPCKDTGELQPVKPFKGHIVVTKNVHIPDSSVSEFPIPSPVTTPGNLKYRNIPFGAEAPTQYKTQRRKSKGEKRKSSIKEEVE